MKFTRLLIMSAAALAVTATSAPAVSNAALAAPTATSAVITDKRGDVELRKDGWDKGIDIERVRYAKSGDNLKSTIKVRDLNAITTEPSLVFYSLTIMIGGRTAYAYSAEPNVAPSVYRAKDAETIPCPGAKTVLGIAKDLVRITVPLTCFDNPKRLAVQANSAQFGGDDGGDLLARDHSEPTTVIRVN